MQVEDYFPNGKPWWVRLQEKGGKRHEMPAHHKLEDGLPRRCDSAERKMKGLVIDEPWDQPHHLRAENLGDALA
jgi:hypothetical protein